MQLASISFCVRDCSGKPAKGGFSAARTCNGKPDPTQEGHGQHTLPLTQTSILEFGKLA